MWQRLPCVVGRGEGGPGGKSFPRPVPTATPGHAPTRPSWGQGHLVSPEGAARRAQALRSSGRGRSGQRGAASRHRRWERTTGPGCLGPPCSSPRRHPPRTRPRAPRDALHCAPFLGTAPAFLPRPLPGEPCFMSLLGEDSQRSHVSRRLRCCFPWIAFAVLRTNTNKTFPALKGNNMQSTKTPTERSETREHRSPPPERGGTVSQERREAPRGTPLRLPLRGALVHARTNTCDIRRENAFDAHRSAHRADEPSASACGTHRRRGGFGGTEAGEPAKPLWRRRGLRPALTWASVEGAAGLLAPRSPHPELQGGRSHGGQGWGGGGGRGQERAGP